MEEAVAVGGEMAAEPPDGATSELVEPERG